MLRSLLYMQNCYVYMNKYLYAVVGKHPDLMVGPPTSTIIPTKDRKFEISQFFAKNFERIEVLQCYTVPKSGSFSSIYFPSLSGPSKEFILSSKTQLSLLKRLFSWNNFKEIKKFRKETVLQWWANLDQASKDLDKTIFRDLSPTPIP